MLPDQTLILNVDDTDAMRYARSRPTERQIPMDALDVP